MRNESSGLHPAQLKTSQLYTVLAEKQGKNRENIAFWYTFRYTIGAMEKAEKLREIAGHLTQLELLNKSKDDAAKDVRDRVLSSLFKNWPLIASAKVAYSLDPNCAALFTMLESRASKWRTIDLGICTELDFMFSQRRTGTAEHPSFIDELNGWADELEKKPTDVGQIQSAETTSDIVLMEKVAQKLKTWADRNKKLIRNFTASLTGPLPPMDYERVIVYLQLNSPDMAGLVQRHYEELISCAKKIDTLISDSSCSALETANSLVRKLGFLTNRLSQTLEVTVRHLTAEKPEETKQNIKGETKKRQKRGRPRKYTDDDLKRMQKAYEEFYEESNDSKAAWNKVAVLYGIKTGNAARVACQKLQKSR